LLGGQTTGRRLARLREGPSACSLCGVVRQHPSPFILPPEANMPLDPMEWLTIGLVMFAGAQLWLQERAERARIRERSADNNEAADRAFHYAWAEHFRLVGLARYLEQSDLIEMAYLGVLQSSDVLPRDWTRLTEALAGLSREAGFLGGVAVALCYDVQRAVSILTNSVQALAREAPAGMREAEKVRWLREQFGPDLEPWEVSVRKQVSELASLMWDAAKHNPRIAVERQLEFSDDLSSDFAKAAVRRIAKRGTADAAG
jgi:hypothetical protein